MLALCLMLSGTNHAKYHASIISSVVSRSLFKQNNKCYHDQYMVMDFADQAYVNCNCLQKILKLYTYMESYHTYIRMYVSK